MDGARLLILMGAAAVLAPAAAGVARAEPLPAAVVRADIRGDRTHFELPAAAVAARSGTVAPPAGVRRLLAAVPPGTTRWSARVIGGDPGMTVRAAERLAWLRDVPVVALEIGGVSGGAASIALSHDGDWAAAAASSAARPGRGHAALLPAAVAGLPAAAKSGDPRDGSYVVIAAPAFAEAVAPLLDWKRRTGLRTVLATTAETGIGNAAIRSWLRDAYFTWEVPPEYVLLVGDVGDIPAWSFMQNVTDLPYALMNEGDWLPDLFVGRWPVANAFEVATIVNKTVAYERTPFLAGGDWFVRQLMVAGNYGSTTPVSTVTFCGQQLETLGFQPPATVFFPPLFNGVTPITNALQGGVSMVAYRGWAYGTAGWEPPHFTVNHIPNVNNGAMTPIVMSFVCLNGDFAAPQPCFGEVFLRAGTPTAPQGAVAFIGNGEHWSHTRYNDAMAIAYFERITDPAVSTLGQLTTAGKLRFIDYFPLEIEAAEWGEESVEFYFHIYSLLGDPELSFYKAVPRPIQATLPAAVSPGANLLELMVTEADGATPLAGARVGAVQGERLLGCAYTDDSGRARIAGAAVEDGASVAFTVTAPGIVPFEGQVAVGTGGGAYLATADCTVDDGTVAPAAGNGDGEANPGETLVLMPTLLNHGAAGATGVVADLAVVGPAAVVSGTASFPDLPAGGQADALAPLVISVDAGAEDGARLLLLLSATFAGAEAPQVSQTALEIVAPRLRAELAIGGDGVAWSGQTAALDLILANEGRAPTTGGSATLGLVSPALGQIVVAEATFGPLAPGAALAVPAAFALSVAGEVPAGAGLALRLSLVTDEGYATTATCDLVAGRRDLGAPVGPDRHGYYAYDSADIDYPGQRPHYQWTELSPAYGGAGTRLDFQVDGQTVLVDLPFVFRYYGREYTRIRVSDSGWISFDLDGFYDFYNWPLPSPHGNHSVVAPFWDNFDPTRPEGDGIYHANDATAGVLIIQWSRQRHYLPEIDDLQTFQLVLRDPAVHPTPTGDGEFLFLYKQVVNSDYLRTYATVGWEDHTETDGLQLSYANLYATGAAPPSPGLAVLVTTRAPDYAPLTLSRVAVVPSAAGTTIGWTPADDRPVIGWLLRRWRDGVAVQLTASPLPATTRSFLDDAPAAASAAYQIIALHPYGVRTDLGLHGAAAGAGWAGSTWLGPCHPNPAPGGTRIEFALARGGGARLDIYDLAGRRVRTLLHGELPAGPGGAVWDGRDERGRDAAGGIYLYRLRAGDQVLTRKLLLVR